MPPLNRRELLQCVGALALAGGAARRVAPLPYVTCFYQFGRQALDVLAGEGGLPDGSGYLHIFSHSHPGMRPHPDTAQMVRSKGSSFRYALALDLHKYPGWRTATHEQLRGWALAFRQQGLHPDGPADYFAFNEMPTTGAATPEMRAQVARWLRLIHDPGDGPPWRGIFYFTERNVNPAHWVGESDDFWAALDETCDLVVGEHYHNAGFVFARTVEALAEHLMALPRWLAGRSSPAARRIAAEKYLVLHSSYYGPNVTGWNGLLTTEHDLATVERYFRHLVAATRHHPLGRHRVGFGPLATRGYDVRALPLLAKVLGEEARAAQATR